MTSQNKTFKKKFIYIYYIILFIIVAFRQSEAAPNLFLRIAFLSAFFIPFIFFRKDFLPASLICFMTVGTYGYAYNFFPYEMTIYPILCFIILLITSKGNICFNKSISFFLFIVFYIFIIDFFDSGKLQNILLSLSTILICGSLIQRKEQFVTLSMFYCFTIISFTISTIYLLNYDRFITSYNLADGIERSGWVDPNYLSTIIGMGIVTSVILLLQHKKANTFEKLFYIITIGISIITQLLLASRGGILSVCGTIIIIFFFTKIPRKYKISIILCLILFIIWLYQNDYFTLLEYRIENDEGTGSGRTDIWETKLKLFYEQDNILNWIFGKGFQSAFELGAKDSVLGFHNDFIAILCGYGLIGILLFLYILYLPIKISSKEKRAIIIALIFYLVLSCSTLEPISAGRFTYFGFYFLTYLFARYSI